MDPEMLRLDPDRRGGKSEIFQCYVVPDGFSERFQQVLKGKSVGAEQLSFVERISRTDAFRKKPPSKKAMKKDYEEKKKEWHDKYFEEKEREWHLKNPNYDPKREKEEAMKAALAPKWAC
jgi:hypothetical protein